MSSARFKFHSKPSSAAETSAQRKTHKKCVCLPCCLQPFSRVLATWRPKSVTREVTNSQHGSAYRLMGLVNTSSLVRWRGTILTRGLRNIDLFAVEYIDLVKETLCASSRKRSVCHEPSHVGHTRQVVVVCHWFRLLAFRWRLSLKTEMKNKTF